MASSSQYLTSLIEGVDFDLSLDFWSQSDSQCVRAMEYHETGQALLEDG
jgi:hypothetical protein